MKDKVLSRKIDHGGSMFAYIFAAIITGFFCVFFMWVFEYALHMRLDYHKIGAYCFISSPLIFLIARLLIDKVAPYAGGTGIPQAIFVAQNINAQNEEKLLQFFSLKTMGVKIACLCLVIVAGGSTGREGPTVQVATCMFCFILLLFRKWAKVKVSMKSAIVAGAASGLAAAFNTPLAGVTFAIEELTPDVFSGIKEFVLIAIIVAALAAKSLTQEYSYFGLLGLAPSIPMYSVVALGMFTGVSGALFSTLLIRGRDFTQRANGGRASKYIFISLCSIGILTLSLIFGDSVMGPGNDVAKLYLNNQVGSSSQLFGLAKIASTLFTFWSGLAAGVFAPCLSIGAALGANLSTWMALPLATCSLLGMTGFLSATVQAPITAFVIIFEMTGDHALLLPVMLTALISAYVARLVGATQFYKTLSSRYKPILG